jgi:hypothetical protein
MRKLITLSLALCISLAVFAQSKPKGGYLGKRFIICAEGSYFPNYSSIKSMLLSYNFQYGANIHFVTGRFSQFGVSYNMYGLGAHNQYDDMLSNSGRIKGYQIGLTYRKFREKKGGLAPIGKFFDVNLYYHSNEYNVQYEDIQPILPVMVRTSGISGSVALGTQGIFWNRVVANTGVRVGGPIFTISEQDDAGDIGDNLDYMQQRLMYKDFFSVFFGVGIIL